MRKLLMVLIPLFFLVTVYLIADTYSLFESEYTLVTSEDIGKWKIKVNNSSLDGKESEFNVDSIIWSSMDSVLDGKVAPGMEGYFDLIIDSNDVDVSYRYDIYLDYSGVDFDQFEITNIEEINGNTIVRTDTSTYSGIVPLSQNDTLINVRVHLKWLDLEENDEKDYLLGSVHGNTVDIPITITFTQHFSGETLTEYVETAEE